ncbi:hypothetical protein PATSB16_40440 [Pandoraea thiooxydans]|nr:hypothetical protein PATSB16_40440 [Pandoraea thiooxydans]
MGGNGNARRWDVARRDARHGASLEIVASLEKPAGIGDGQTLDIVTIVF